jgi:hypothetical protein
LGFGISRSERALCLSKYLSVFVWTYAGLCRDRRRHARLRLNLNLNLSLNLALNLNLNLFLFKKPFEKLFQVTIGDGNRFRFTPSP